MKIILLIGLLSVQLLAADALELGASFLYLRPNIDDTHFVLSSFDNTFKGSVYPKGKRHQNSTSFTPAFSIEGFHEPSCIGLNFLYFNARSTASVTGDFLYDTNGFPGFRAQESALYKGKARSKNTYNYCAADITYRLSYLSFGLHGAYIQFKEHTTSLGTFRNNDMIQPLSNHLHRNSQFYGIGPKLGVDYQIPFSDTWSLIMNATGSLLCCNTKSDLRCVSLRTGPGGAAILNGSNWRVVPSAQSELGIQYLLMNVSLEFGYKLIWYSQCANKLTDLDVAFPADSIDVYNSFSLHGLYFRLSGCF